MKGSLKWYILVGIDNGEYKTLNELIEHCQKHGYTEEETRFEYDSCLENGFLKFINGVPLLTIEGYIFLEQLSTQFDLYFDPNWENDLTWLHVFQYLADLKQEEIDVKVFGELKKDAIILYNQYLKSVQTKESVI